jgi:hypothetical protein
MGIADCAAVIAKCRTLGGRRALCWAAGRPRQFGPGPGVRRAGPTRSQDEG